PDLSAAMNTAVPARKDHEKWLRDYKTEYRAHSYQGADKFDRESTTATKQQMGETWTNRQWAVFKHIHDLYPWVATASGSDPPTPWQREFRTAVVAYVNPDTEGYNKYNSMRVKALYEALNDVASGTNDERDDTVVAVLAVVAKLTPAD